jgi:hypothetical protein
MVFEIKIITKFREHMWSVPLIGGMIIVISLFTPVATEFTYIHNIVFYWMLGSYVNYFYGDFNRGLNNNLLSYIPSVVASIIIGISALIILYCAYKYQNDQRDPKKLIVISSSVIIISALLWIIFMEVGWQVEYNLSFWRLYVPNVGIFGIFLGAVLALYGNYIIKNS